MSDVIKRALVEHPNLPIVVESTDQERGRVFHELNYAKIVRDPNTGRDVLLLTQEQSDPLAKERAVQAEIERLRALRKGIR